MYYYYNFFKSQFLLYLPLLIFFPVFVFLLPLCSFFLLFFGFSDLYFLVDTKLADPIPNSEHGPCGGSSFGNLGFESPSSGFNERDCGAEYTFCQNSSLLDNMKLHGLLEEFKNEFEEETMVKDRQRLKLHISFGLQNLVDLDKGLNHLKQGITFDVNEGKSNMSSSNDFCSSSSVSFTSVINDQTLSGCQQVEKESIVCYDSLLSFSSDDNRVGFDILDSGEKDVHVTKKRLRKPTRRYIEEASEQRGGYHSRKCGISYGRAKDKFHVGSHEQNLQAAFGASSLDCQEEFFDGACIQVPFGLPVQEGCSKRNTSVLVSMFLQTGLHESSLFYIFTGVLKLNLTVDSAEKKGCLQPG